MHFLSRCLGFIAVLAVLGGSAAVASPQGRRVMIHKFVECVGVARETHTFNLLAHFVKLKECQRRRTRQTAASDASTAISRRGGGSAAPLSMQDDFARSRIIGA